MIAWLRYRLCRALARRLDSHDEPDYPKTLRGGWRYLREQAAVGEVDWYECERTGGRR